MNATASPPLPTFDAAPAKTYGIKPGYEHRTVNATLEEEAGDYWNPTRLLLSRYAQYAVYDLAAGLVRERGLKTVLDVGCGLGHKLHDLLNPFADVTGVDQPSCVEASRQLLPDLSLTSADFEKPDATGLGTYDLVMSVDVIEHLLDPDMLLDFIRAHCHANSVVVVSTPERDVRRGTSNNRSPKAEHVREWNRAELRAYLDASGFSVDRHVLLPAFKVGWSRYMIKERWRLLRKGISHRYTQAAVCRVRPQ